ncbi:isopentenyl-diphosphate Delta-isomerase [Planktotalea arctica]|uniref:isopentenyl-diphosphate Delta-isomerase n=1 Tax=Planktotalea arctica TaxID=1481893 RepID=UPI000A1731FC|nr:isopentenyl-diphosphate Delta-isomerase [Planktotalea arctica]
MTIMIPAWVEGVLSPVEKLDAHLRGLRHKAISVFLICNGKILIQRRALGKYHTPGLWANTCCTHPNWDEPSQTCAARRLHEELGLRDISTEFRGQVEYRADVGAGMTEHEVVDIFVAHTKAQPVIKPHPEEVMDFDWVGFEDLARLVVETPAQYTPWLKIYLSTFADTIFTDAERLT